MVNIPLTKPSIGAKEISSVVETLKSGWLTTGPKTKLFEENLQRYLGCKKAVGLTSCTGGLHIALAALGIKPGDEVIVPTYTFAATAHVVEWLGAKPVFVDSERDTFNIDPKKIKEAITKRTKAIIPVHFAGHSCRMDEIMHIAWKHDLHVIEDAAHAIGTEYKGKKIGNIGHATAFSFYVTKTMTTGEGGAVVTNSKRLGKKLKRHSYFGIDKDVFNRYSETRGWYYAITDLGYKYNMSDIQAAIGIEQLKRLDKFIEKRRKLAKLYDKLFRSVLGITTPIEKDYTKHSYHLYPILLEDIPRDSFINKLRERGIGTSVHFIPLHLHPYYSYKPTGFLAECYRYSPDDRFPVAEDLFKREVSLPLYPEMSEKDVRRVVECIQKIL